MNAPAKSGMAMMNNLSPDRRQALQRQGIEAFKAYMRTIESMYAHIHAISVPTMLIDGNGVVTYEPAQWTAERLAEIDKLAASMKETFPWESYCLERPNAVGHRET